MIQQFRMSGICLLFAASATSSVVQAQTPLKQHALLHATSPYPSKTTAKAIDRGTLARESETPISVTVALRLPKMEEAEGLLKAVHTPSDPQYHQFLTAEQFNARFAPPAADVAKVIAHLTKSGLTVERTGTTSIKATGLPAAMERAFSVSLHHYEVLAGANARGYTYHAALSHPTLPAEISASVAGVLGLDSRPRFSPHSMAAPKSIAKAQPKATGGNEPGYFTTADFTDFYNVKPLYKNGVTGTGRTLGILTFASFTPSDAFAYWKAEGLSVDPKRITVVNVDGGPGAPSDDSGSSETSLDVEQSGGVAPGAKILVYQAPNTTQGFVDLFTASVETNKADSLSISWGAWEVWNNSDFSPVTDPNTGLTIGASTAIHQLLVRAAIQGQTVFASTGDTAAYDVNDQGCPLSDCSLTLSVNYPASDPAITAAGGTTLPGDQYYCLNQACSQTYRAHLPYERVWSWDYLNGLCSALGYDPISCGVFPVGSGGGVSVAFERPSYQYFLPGVQHTFPGQRLIVDGQLMYNLPGYYAGRNLPDVSFNADPETGYLLYYTSDVDGFGILTGYGGTSFVAPQLNGVSALLGQDLGGRRLGLLNFPLYRLASTGQAYNTPGAPLKMVPHGNNDFYWANNTYNPASGLGTIDVANFAKVLKTQF